MRRPVSFLTLPAALLVGFVACEQYVPPEQGDAYVFHASFDRGAPHANLDCDACHIVAAGVMLQLPGDAPDTNWVTSIPVQQDNACLTCHPFMPNGPNGPEANADCDKLYADWQAACATDPNTQAPALLRSEACRFDTFHELEFVAAGCTGGGCHDYQTQSDWNYSGYDRFAACPDGGGGGGGGGNTGSPHDPGGFWQLEGGHAGVLCADCHTTGNYADLNGLGDRCTTCHDRSETTAGAGHYPSPSGVETDRDCIACHVDPLTGNDGYQSTYERFVFAWPSTWSQAAHDHGGGFYISHGPAYTVFDCESCHNQYAFDATQPNDYRFEASVGRDDCQRCHGATAPLPEGYIGHAPTDTQACTDCHADGT